MVKLQLCVTTSFGTYPLDELPDDLCNRWKTVRKRKDGMPDKRYAIGRDLWHETEQWSMRQYMQASEEAGRG